MKNVISYIFSYMLICTYMVTNLGFGIHSCTNDGSSKVVLLFGEELCHHVAAVTNRGDRGQGECSCAENHCKHCCDTRVYVVDDAHYNIDNIHIELQIPTLVSTFLAMPCNLRHYSMADLRFCAAPIVFGSGGGHSTFGSLRC